MDVRERQNQAAHIEALIQEVTALPDPQIRAKTEELLQALLEMYGSGLERILEITAQAETAGQGLIETFARDELVEALLLLHGLHPLDLETRIRQAVARVRTHGTTVEFVRVEDGIAYLHLAGGCQTCPSSAGALRQTIETAIYSAAPDLDELRIEDASAPQRASVPIKFIPPRKRKQNSNTGEQADTQQGTGHSPANISGAR